MAPALKSSRRGVAAPSGPSVLGRGQATGYDADRLGPLPAVDDRVSMVLNDEVIGGTLRRWTPQAEIRLDRPAPLPLPARGLLQFMSAEGVLHQRGALAPDATERGHCIAFRPQGSPQLLLARRRLRTELSLPVTVRREHGLTVQTTTINIGESGVLLAGPTSLRVGEEISLTIHLGIFSGLVDAMATIVRVTDEQRAAAHYTEIDKEARERLGWRIFDHVLMARRSPRR
jgi:hypothetical protein